MHPSSFPLSTRSFGLIFLPKVINAEDTSSFLLMTLWKTSSYREHNRISKAQQTHREVKGSYENLMKTRCPRLITLTWFARAPHTLIRPLTVQLPLHTIQAFKQQLHWNGGGSSKDTKAKVDCLVWKNSASCFRMRKYTANNIHMGTHRHFLRRAPLRCGS